MPEHAVGTRDEWLVASKELLAAEKEHSRRGDELARRRRDLPWVRVEKEYVFETGDGPKTLAELFDGRSQLLVYHFMFGFGYRVDEQNPGCTGCSFVAEFMTAAHLILVWQEVDDPNLLRHAARARDVGRNPRVTGYRSEYGPSASYYAWIAAGRPVHGVKTSA